MTTMMTLLRQFIPTMTITLMITTRANNRNLLLPALQKRAKKRKIRMTRKGKRRIRRSRRTRHTTHSIMMMMRRMIMMHIIRINQLSVTCTAKTLNVAAKTTNRVKLKPLQNRILKKARPNAIVRKRNTKSEQQAKIITNTQSKTILILMITIVMTIVTYHLCSSSTFLML